jgi:hypothetical protein
MEDTESLLQEDVDKFISREVVFKRIFSRYISSINIIELPKATIDGLVKLCKESFKIVWGETDSNTIYQKIKLLNSETEALIIPSRSGRNITNTLNLRTSN